MGACTAAQVGVDKGILTPEQQTALIDATAESLRATYADLLAQLKLPEEERLTAANCPRLIERFKPQAPADPEVHWPPLAFGRVHAGLISLDRTLLLLMGWAGRDAALRPHWGDALGASPPCSGWRGTALTQGSAGPARVPCCGWPLARCARPCAAAAGEMSRARPPPAAFTTDLP